VPESPSTRRHVLDTANTTRFLHHFVGIQELLETPKLFAVIAKSMLKILHLGALAVRLYS